MSSVASWPPPRTVTPGLPGLPGARAIGAARKAARAPRCSRELKAHGVRILKCATRRRPREEAGRATRVDRSQGRGGGSASDRGAAAAAATATSRGKGGVPQRSAREYDPTAAVRRVRVGGRRAHPWGTCYVRPAALGPLDAPIDALRRLDARRSPTPPHPTVAPRPRVPTLRHTAPTDAPSTAAAKRKTLELFEARTRRSGGPRRRRSRRGRARARRCSSAAS